MVLSKPTLARVQPLQSPAKFELSAAPPPRLNGPMIFSEIVAQRIMLE